MTTNEIQMIDVKPSNEKIHRLMKGYENDVIQRVMKLLDRSLDDQVLSSTYALYRYAYMVYKTLSKEYGKERGLNLYFGFWFVYADWCMKLALEEMKIKSPEEVKSIPMMAELFKRMLNIFGEITKVSESSEERAVVDMIACPCCMLAPGPFDSYMEKVTYFKEVDSSYETGYGKFCSDWPNICSLDDEVEGRLTEIMCLGGTTCQTVFKRKKKE